MGHQRSGWVVVFIVVTAVVLLVAFSGFASGAPATSNVHKDTPATATRTAKQQATTTATNDADDDLVTPQSSASDLHTIQGRLLPADLAKDNIITLHGNGGRMSVVPTQRGTFQLHEIPAGAYLLEVVSATHAYPQIRIDVSDKAGGKIRARVEESNKNVAYPLELRPLGPVSFFTERKGFNLWSFVQNPMMIMVVVTGVIILLAKLVGGESMRESMQELGLGNQPTNPSELLARITSAAAEVSSGGSGSTAASQGKPKKKKKNN
eukprot:TRINITY_DN1671_c0_g1_i1.p1 TRINITY_DN1671_c0_g1~~TRINITY_DN1671_c0_g1_i1.p1  ORF type:complete len:272 (-),score=58.14 TRINITY_DN1671_c0_g1_i1:13-807(-)